MLTEVAKPIALALCMLSLCAVFYTAFLVPSNDLEKTIWDSVILLSLAAGICLTSGMIFRESTPNQVERVTRTLPVQMFCWAVGAMLLFFLASWYLETHCIFYKDVRRF
jgi:glucose uptake protein GlcU